MKSTRWITIKALFLLTILFHLAAHGQEIQLWTADAPKPFLALESGLAEKTIEISALAPIDVEGRFLLAADDENADLLIINADSARVVKTLLIPGIAKKPKWEALARDEDGNYYAVGSHSVKPLETDAAKLKARSRLFSFRLKITGTDAKDISINEEFGVREWDISDSLKSEGYSPVISNNKVKVEGLAVKTIFDSQKRKVGRELIIGLREPNEPVRVHSANIEPLPAAGAKLVLSESFTFNPGAAKEGIPFRLSSIEYVADWRGFLILTSTEDGANIFHGNKLWFVSDEKIAKSASLNVRSNVEPQQVWKFGVDIKAEGICLLFGKNASDPLMRFALAYDNDGRKPGLLQQISLMPWN